MKGTGISLKARQEVFDRDNIDGALCCIYCGNPYGVQLAHYIGRAQGGKGIPENLCPLCAKCHQIMDNGADTKVVKRIRAVCKDHLARFYPEWDEEKLKVRKQGGVDENY